MTNLRFLRIWATVGCLLTTSGLLAGTAVAAQNPNQKSDQKSDKDADSKPKINLKAQPMIAMSPARIVLTAEIVGGPNDYEDFYCAGVEWDWGDGTQSESSSDCEPYEPGKSEIKRHFTVAHTFRAGQFRVTFKLKRRDKAVGFASVSLQIRPGLRDTGQ